MIIKPEAQNENQLAHTKGNFMCCEENPFNEKPRKIIMYVQIASDKTEKKIHINLSNLINFYLFKLVIFKPFS